MRENIQLSEIRNFASDKPKKEELTVPKEDNQQRCRHQPFHRWGLLDLSFRGVTDTCPKLWTSGPERLTDANITFLEDL